MALTAADRASRSTTAYSEQNEKGRDLRSEAKVRICIKAQWLHVARTPTVHGPRLAGGEFIRLPESEAARLIADGYARAVE